MKTKLTVEATGIDKIEAWLTVSLPDGSEVDSQSQSWRIGKCSEQEHLGARNKARKEIENEIDGLSPQDAESVLRNYADKNR